MSLEMPFAGNCLRLEHFNSFGTSRLDCAFTYISFEVCNLLFKMQNEGKSNFARKVSNVCVVFLDLRGIDYTLLRQSYLL